MSISADDGKTFHTFGGLEITRTTHAADSEEFNRITASLDNCIGILLSSTYEVPSRYSRWDIGFVNPPLQITGKELGFTLEALNERGGVLLKFCHFLLEGSALWELTVDDRKIQGRITASGTHGAAEEYRTRTPSLFSVLRALMEGFQSEQDSTLGFYGAFGYDLVFQFEQLEKMIPRSPEQRDIVLFIPDRVFVRDNIDSLAKVVEYDFVFREHSTLGKHRENVKSPYHPSPAPVELSSDHQPGEFAQCVCTAKESFARGDLFEVVPGQTFARSMPVSPSAAFLKLRNINPAPYGFLMNLGDNEFLIGASPEMFVRVQGRRVETSPISGTIARGTDAIDDAVQIQTLLNSSKDEAELTMCTDVDRNDKSRICEAGSVRVIGRRQIEMYSRVIHTVDHIEGILKEEYDSLDAFITHMWAVTVTGAPKLWAIKFLERYERTPRYWYGGAVGVLGFNGNINTGLTLRTIRVKDGVAQVRAGATLLYFSDPDEEENETRIKAKAMLEAIEPPNEEARAAPPPRCLKSRRLRALLADHDDSFVHTLANYFSQTGLSIETFRYNNALSHLNADIDLLILSPGPGRPANFATDRLIDSALALGVPIFGVCLGLQAIVEYYGGKLGQLSVPCHGTPSRLKHVGTGLFRNMPQNVIVGRYHSLYAERESLPSVLKETATSDDDIIMAIEHVGAPVWAVQFHPESMLSARQNRGMELISNVVSLVGGASRRT